MTCPVQAESLLGDRGHPNSVEVKLTPNGGIACIKKEAARNPTLASWVADKVEGRTEALPYFQLAGHLGMEQRATMIIMAAVHVGNPTRFKLLHEPEGMPADPTGIEGVIKDAFMNSGLAGTFPRLQVVTENSDVGVLNPVVLKAENAV